MRHSAIPIFGFPRAYDTVLRYGAAAFSIGVALAISLLLRHYHLPHPFISFSFAAIAIIFWYGGTGPGLLALLLSYSARSYFSIPAAAGHAYSESWLFVYGMFGLFVGWFSLSRRRAERLLARARDDLEIRVVQRTAELTMVNHELENTQAELHAQKDRLQLLLDLTTNAVSNLEIGDLLKAVTASIRQIRQSDFAGIGLPDPESGRLRIHALLHSGDGSLIEQEILASQDAALSDIFSTGKSSFGTIKDLIGSQPENGSVPSWEFETACVLPLLSRNRPLGIMMLGKRGEDVCRKEDVDFLAQVANQIAIAVDNALSYRRVSELTDKLAQEKLYLEDEIREDAHFEEIVGNSTELHRVLKLVETVAPTDSTVLINGETGTGKELIARAIHNLSPRRSGTFVKLNCAAIPTGLLESELFGHEKGAFTGAVVQRIGRLELANNGTLFLDEVGDISLELQPKLLRVLQEREFERLGSTRTLSTNVRLIVATNRDLGAMVEAQTFRSDLFFRLNVFPVKVPALRERSEDIPLLVRHFANEFSRRMNKTIETISSETMDALCQYHWPGNIRELQNVIERAVILSRGPALVVPLPEIQANVTPTTSGEEESSRPTRRQPVRSILADVDREQILHALKEAGGRVGGRNGAAFRLGLKRTTLITRMNKLGIHPNGLSEHDGASTDTSDTSDAEPAQASPNESSSSE
jgi:formate hydrogenlyase transcriptional activator